MEIKQKNIIKLSQKTNGRCFYCNKDGEEIDHFLPKRLWEEYEMEKVIFFKGRHNHIENLVLACKRCNVQKKDKSPDEFMGGSYKCWDRFWRANKRIGIF